MMYLQIVFPSGQYYGAEPYDASKPEWPPHPSRLFSALTAAAYQNKHAMSEGKRSVLEWLETLPPPAIAYPDADLASAPTSYVPPGDIRGQKGKKDDKQYEHGVLRWRQPRQFPKAIILGNPVLYYEWPEDPEPALFHLLDEIAADITHVGTSHSIAVVKPILGRMPQPAGLFPHVDGSKFLRVPLPGRLRELDAVFEQSSGVRRPVPACEKLSAYRFAGHHAAKRATRGQFIPLRITGTMHGAATAAYLGRALRRAVMSILGDDAPAAVHGHNEQSHVGWIPLPDVGHEHANGRIVGIALMIPWEMDLSQRNALLSAMGRLRDLHLPDGRVAQIVSPDPAERLPMALRKHTWTRSSETWATVTPVVLDRAPKRLTEQKIRTAFLQSLVFAGYPEPEEMEISRFSLFKGAPPAFRIPEKKPRYHAIIKFKTSIEGPVIAGRLRYFGIGLFRPFQLPEKQEVK